MPKELYNEGRVVGYSQYETYVKHALSENPDEEPASEREWLASQLNHGLSLLLKVKADPELSNPHFIDVPLPENSKLGAASTIIGSLFFGQGECDELGWVKKVTSYGDGLPNRFEAHPYSSNPLEYPTDPMEDFTEDEKLEFLQYMKIQDGLILQPGSWIETPSGNPNVDLIPNLQEKPVLRLILASKISKDFYLLLTGFTHRSVISGITDIDTGSTSEIKYQNGAILGPEIYPWGNKVVFTYPGIAAYYLRKGLISTYDNLKIDHDEDSSETRFTASYLKPGTGVSIYGPNEPGGDIKIGAKIGKDINNYIKVEQKVNQDENLDNDEIVTVLTHSHINIGPGIAYHSPTKPGQDVYISSIVASKNNYLKVSQTSTDSSEKAQETTTELTASTLISSKTGGIKIIQPATPGASVTLQNKITSKKPGFLNIVQDNYETTLDCNITFGDGLVGEWDNNGNLKISLDLTRIINLIFNDNTNPLTAALKKIVTAVYGSNWKSPTDFSFTGMIASGNLNIFSRENSSLRCRNLSNDDIKFN